MRRNVNESIYIFCTWNFVRNWLSSFYFMNREEKIEKQIEIDQKIYSTKILDVTMENVVKKK